MAVWPATAAWCSGVAPQAPKGSETSTAGGLHPVALHRQTPAAVGETAISGVNSVSFIFSKIVRRAGSMAATIVAGVCEDHQDYELKEPSTTEFPKKGKPFLTTNKTYLNISQAFSIALSHPYSSRPN